ncbi:hypothetical protein [Streptomyces cyaneofuscatus]|uniref:hypothetical protein n=1 Tax=Streptomyces cyaneofuscatus TaxID=66883 RepID=UPI00368B1A4A
MGLLDPINALGEIGVDVLVCGPAASRHCPSNETLGRAGRSPFTVVVDRDDDVRCTRTVLAAHDPSAGRIVIHPTVGGGDRLLWHDILHAAAGDRGLAAPSCAARGSAHEQERSARAALKAAAVHRMTILRAHRIGLGLWTDLMALHQATGTDVTLVHHAELPAGSAHLLRHCHHRVLTDHRAVRALYPSAGAAQSRAADGRRPIV